MLKYVERRNAVLVSTYSDINMRGQVLFATVAVLFDIKAHILGPLAFVKQCVAAVVLGGSREAACTEAC